MNTTLRTLLALSALATFAGCAKKDTDHAHDHGAEKKTGGHVHTAPHGGTLVEIGQHQFNLEFVLDAGAGTLTAYTLDAHAEGFVRTAMPAINATAMIAGKPEPLVFVATASEVTGEKPGDTSTYTATAPWLKTTAEFALEITQVNFKGAVFDDIDVHFPQGAADHDDHGKDAHAHD